MESTANEELLGMTVEEYFGAFCELIAMKYGVEDDDQETMKHLLGTLTMGELLDFINGFKKEAAE